MKKQMWADGYRFFALARKIVCDYMELHITVWIIYSCRAFGACDILKIEKEI